MVTQELIDYVKQQLEQGINDEQIKQTLIANNWQGNDIEEVFNVVKKLLTPKSFKKNVFISIIASLIAIALIIILGCIDKYIISYFHPFHGLSKIIATLVAYVLCVLILFAVPILLGTKRGWKDGLLSLLFELFWIITLTFVYGGFSTSGPPSGTGLPEKPVIYLYPQQKQDVSVQLDYTGKIIADYPRYNKSDGGWNVTAYPDGHLINKEDDLEYSYLFWEGSVLPIKWDMTKGFIVEGKNTREFLQNTLSKMGLTPKEYNEFIVYWYPRMKDNKYNLISFADKQYTENAPLTIVPKPDSMRRVFMVFKPLNKKIEIEPQEIKSFERKGFTVIEWGGTEIE